MYDPLDGLPTFSGASLLLPGPPTPPTPLMPLTPTMLNMPDTPLTHAPMPVHAYMQSLFDTYFHSAGNGNGSVVCNNTAAPARASSTFDGLLCISPMPVPTPVLEPALKPATVPATKPMYVDAKSHSPYAHHRHLIETAFSHGRRWGVWHPRIRGNLGTQTQMQVQKLMETES
ncbi:hypothetical protein B0F90DRAFT_1791088, partial [Multifurca ochricompacta]